MQGAQVHVVVSNAEIKKMQSCLPSFHFIFFDFIFIVQFGNVEPGAPIPPASAPKPTTIDKPAPAGAGVRGGSTSMGGRVLPGTSRFSQSGGGGGPAGSFSAPGGSLERGGGEEGAGVRRVTRGQDEGEVVASGRAGQKVTHRTSQPGGGSK